MGLVVRLSCLRDSVLESVGLVEVLALAKAGLEDMFERSCLIDDPNFGFRAEPNVPPGVPKQPQTGNPQLTHSEMCSRCWIASGPADC